MEDAPLMVGQSIGHIKDIMTCKELLEKMHDDAIACSEEGFKPDSVRSADKKESGHAFRIEGMTAFVIVEQVILK
ncbi:MAG: hypothetical protein MZV63_57655 [Marinilabiliales bacterium]|nr:hypothetical protein [Marinilabiliales bacterium]